MLNQDVEYGIAAGMNADQHSAAVPGFKSAEGKSTVSCSPVDTHVCFVSCECERWPLWLHTGETCTHPGSEMQNRMLL